MSEEKGPETAPDIPRKRGQKMVNVVNTHRFRKFFLKGGAIGPGQCGKMPAPMFDKIQDSCPWIKRAERGDVI